MSQLPAPAAASMRWRGCSADKMSAPLGQTVVVENRGGASGSSSPASRSPADRLPDGSAVLIASNSMVVAQAMNPNVGLDIVRDLKAL